MKNIDFNEVANLIDSRLVQTYDDLKRLERSIIEKQKSELGNLKRIGRRIWKHVESRLIM